MNYKEYKDRIIYEFEYEKKVIKFLYILALIISVPILIFYAYKDNVLWYHIISFVIILYIVVTLCYYMHLGDVETSYINKISRIEEKIDDERYGRNRSSNYSSSGGGDYSSSAGTGGMGTTTNYYSASDDD